MEYMIIPTSPFLKQHLLFSVFLKKIYFCFFVITILLGREWYLTVISICISLITNDVRYLFCVPVSQLNTCSEEMPSL